VKKYQAESYKVTRYVKELIILQQNLWINVIDFIRTKEPDFIESKLSKESSNEKLLEAISKYPKLLERPIAIKWDKAVLCRPPANIQSLL